MSADSEILIDAAAPGRGRAFDAAAEALMLVLLAFMPLAFGAVEAWSEQVVLALAGAMLACLLARTAVLGGGLVRTWAYVPLAAGAAIAAVQLAPLPAWVVSAISPATAATKARLLGDLPGAGENMTLSFYPLMTERSLRMALALGAVFTVTVNVHRRREQVVRLLSAVAAIGGAVAVLALAQVVTGTDRIYWLAPTGRRAAQGGTFFNYNNYCQFMNLSLGAGLGLGLMMLREGFRGGPVTLPRVCEVLGDRRLRAVWWLAGMMAAGIATVLLSLSRGGMVSMLVGGGFAAVVLARRSRLDTWGWAMTAVVLAALVCVLYVGFDAVYDRLASLWTFKAYQGRWELARETVRAGATFPAVGSGLGTHAVVHPMFDESAIAARAAHAENDYAQLFEEAGVAGLLAAGWFAAAVGWALVRCIRRPEPIGRVAAAGLGAGLVAVAVHSMGDFGQHLPAIGILTAATCGLVVGLGRSRRRGEGASPGPTRWSPAARRWSAGAALAATAAVWAWGLAGADAARRAEAHWRAAEQIARHLRKNHWAGDNAEYARLVGLAGQAVAAEPRNVLYRHWLNAYRWRGLSRVTDPATGAVALGPAAGQAVRGIVADLDRARLDCPTYSPAYALAGQLRWGILGQRRGAELIRKAAGLSPCDASACFAAGTLDAHEGNYARSVRTFRRALQLDDGLFDGIVNVCLHRLDRPDLALAVADDSPPRLLKLSGRLAAGGRHGAEADQARRRATDLLRRQADSPQTKAPVLAQLADLCLGSADYESAADYYRRALAKDCSDVLWRLGLAKALAGARRPAEAMDQARMCLRLQPGMPQAKRLLASLRGLAGAEREN